MGKFVRPRRIGHQRRHIQFKQNRVDFFDAAGHGRFFVQEAEITDFFVAFKDIQPHHVIRPIGFIVAFFQGQRFHVGIAGHVFQNAFGFPEKHGDVFAVRGESPC